VNIRVIVPSAASLPFVRAAGDHIESLWSIVESGDWSADNQLGRAYADACLDYMRQSEFPGLLAHVLTEMIGSRRLGGVEIGFLHGIAVRAMVE